MLFSIPAEAWPSTRICVKIIYMSENTSDKLNISRRLELLAEMAPAVDTVCDIGADHAWLLIRLIQLGKVRRGIAVEVTEGPYRRSARNIEAFGLEKRLEARLGDGLGPIRPGEASAAVIAGMGGGTIGGILERSPGVVKSLDYLLLQPMSQPALVRRQLRRLGFRILREAMLEERDILYPIILAEPGEMPELSPEEAEYGPLLIRERPPELLRELRRQLWSWRRIQEGLKKSSLEASREKEAKVREEIGKLEELIKCLYPAEA